MDRDISPPLLKRRKISPKSNPEKTISSTLPRSIRIFSWNINGIEPFLPPSSRKITSFFSPSNPSESKPPPQPTTSGLRAFLHRHNWPDVLFLQELKINPNDTKTLSALLSSLNTPLNHPTTDTLTSTPTPSPNITYQLHTVLPHRNNPNTRAFQGKLYGVATLLRTDFAQSHVALVRPADWDLEGRVSIVELTPPPSNTPSKRKPLALINVYAVNGTSSPHRCPETGRVIGTRHDHKRAFHSCLRDECLGLEGRGFEVVVAGDVNVARGVLDGYPRLRTVPREHCVNRADFEGKFFGWEDMATVTDGKREGGDGDGEVFTGSRKSFGGVDVFRALYGGERRYTYYPRTREWGSSCDRVDMVIVSRGLWNAGRVLGTGILDTPQERGVSDHVPLWVEVALDDVSNGKEESEENE